MGNTSKIFRLNAFITYWEGVNILNFRTPILQMIKNFCWLYHLDYYIDEETQLFDTSEMSVSVKTDLIYLRSTDQTCINSKEFRKVLLGIFEHSDLHSQGVEVSHQMLKYLPKYPFPSEFYRPLKYPYVEHYKDGRKKLYIAEEALGNLPLDN